MPKKTPWETKRSQTIAAFRRLKKTMGDRGKALLDVAIVQMKAATATTWADVLKEARQYSKQAIAADRLSEADRLAELERELEKLRKEDAEASEVTPLRRPA